MSWLPAGTICRDRRLTPSKVRTSPGGTIGGFEIAGRGPAATIGVMSAEQYREHSRSTGAVTSRGRIPESTPNFSLDPASFRPDQSVVLFGSPKPFGGDPEGGFQARFQVVEGPVPPCEPVPAPASGIGAIALSGGGGVEVDQAPGGSEGRPAATVAEAAGAPAEAPPQPGQLLYTKTKVVQLQGWEAHGRGSGSRAKPRRFTARRRAPGASAMPALVPTAKEVWTAPDGRTRVREALGRIHFLSGADQRRWEDAGSPPPFEYDPAEHHLRRDAAGRLFKEYASHSWRGRHAFSNVAKLSRLPTDPEALRLAIDNGRAGHAPAAPSPARSHRGAATAERLLEILAEPITSAALRGAAFRALAELPGIGREHGVADAAGRRGEALTWVRDRGFGRELIFDPRTSTVLAQAETIFGPPSTTENGVPPGTVFRETAYLRSGIVDSMRERPGQ